MPEAGEGIDHAQIAEVVAHLLEGDDGSLPEALEENGWWDLWAEDRAGLAQTFFSVEGRRGRVSPALAGFLLRLLEAGGAGPDAGMVIGTGPSGVAGEAAADGTATITGLLFAGSQGGPLVAPVRDEAGLVALVRIPRSSLGVPVGAEESLGLPPLVSGTAAAQPLGADGRNWDVAWRFARRAWATQLVAMAEVQLAAAVEHSSGRQQFGRPIASFQAVKHHLARVKVAIESARPVVQSAWRTDREIDTLAAKALAGTCYLEAHNRGIRVMGGMGYSREHPIGRYHRVGLALEAIGGSTLGCFRAAGSLAAGTADMLRSPVVGGPSAALSPA